MIGPLPSGGRRTEQRRGTAASAGEPVPDPGLARLISGRPPQGECPPTAPQAGDRRVRSGTLVAVQGQGGGRTHRSGPARRIEEGHDGLDPGRSSSSEAARQAPRQGSRRPFSALPWAPWPPPSRPISRPASGTALAPSWWRDGLSQGDREVRMNASAVVGEACLTPTGTGAKARRAMPSCTR